MLKINPLKSESDWLAAVEAIRDLVRALGGRMVVGREWNHFEHVEKIAKKGVELGLLEISSIGQNNIIIQEIVQS